MKQKIKTIIVEDMARAKELLRADLKAYCPKVEIVGEASSVVTGAKLLRQVKPDLIFLDIMLGDGTGFDLLEIFPNLNAKVIFVTAHEEHAIQAFRYAAIDYLLKPINTDDLIAAVMRASNQIGLNRESLSLLKNTIQFPDRLPQRISLSNQEKISVVDIDQIVRCESDGNNTRVFLKNGEKIFVTKTLKQYEELLLQHHFLRTHQSHLINTLYIKEYNRSDGGYLLLKDGQHIPVSVRKKKTIMDYLEEIR